MSEPGGKPDPRDAVCRSLAEHAARFPNLSIRRFEPTGLAPRDAAMACAIHDAAVRRWLTLTHLLRMHTRQSPERLEPRAQGALLCGAAQLILMDRIPPHAAVHESVEWAKRRIRPGAGALVNAVLRALSGRIAGRRERWSGGRDEIPLQDGSSLVLTDPLLPEDEMERLAVATGHLPAMVRRWSELRSGPALRELALHDIAPAPTILNTAHAIGALPECLVPHDTPGNHVFTAGHTDLAALLTRRPDIWVQDPASSGAVSGAAELTPRVIVDLCAGQGTKSRQLAAEFPDSRLVVSDVDPNRLALLRDLFRGQDRVRVAADSELAADTSLRADLVLLDVPCSNTGVLARRVEAKYRFGHRSLASLVELQRRIIRRGVGLLAEAGGLLYSTCSLEPEENDRQVAWMTRLFRLRLRSKGGATPRGGRANGEGPRSYSDGSFWALFERSHR